MALEAETNASIAALDVNEPVSTLRQVRDMAPQIRMLKRVIINNVPVKGLLLASTTSDSRGPGTWHTVDLQNELYDTAEAHAPGTGTIVVPAGVSWTKLLGGVRAHGNGGLGAGVALAARVLVDGVLLGWPGEVWAATLAPYDVDDTYGDVRISTPWVGITTGAVITLQWYHPNYSMTVASGDAWLAAEFK